MHLLINVRRLVLPAVFVAVLTFVVTGIGFAESLPSGHEVRSESTGPIKFRIELVPVPSMGDGGATFADGPVTVVESRVSGPGTWALARLDIDSGTGRVTNRLLGFAPTQADANWLAMYAKLGAPASKAATNETDDVTVGQSLADLAAHQIGLRYRFGGTSPKTGFDCSGLVQYVLRERGITIGRDTTAQWKAGVEVSRDNLIPGDLVFFQNTYRRGLSHVGVYAGNGRFIDAVDERLGVKENSLSNPYWDTRFYGARRVR